MSEHDPEQFIPFLIGDVARLFRKKFQQRVQRLNLTGSQARVLGQINMNQGINQKGLADRLEVENMTLTRLIDKLEDSGFVERRADPNDRRAWRLYLTAAAQPILDEMWVVAEEIHDEAFAGLTAQQRDALVTGLSHARANLAEAANGNGVANPTKKREPAILASEETALG